MASLLEQISYDKAYRDYRLNAARWVLQHPETLPQLIDYVYEKEQTEISHKAAWVLEFVALEDLSQIGTHLDAFLKDIQFPKKEQTVRPLANICEKICLAYYKKYNAQLREKFTSVHKEKMIETCFDWIITDKKVACTARAMTCLYYLGTEINWIHPELIVMLEQKIPTGSTGYKNRALKIIKAIKNNTMLKMK